MDQIHGTVKIRTLTEVCEMIFYYNIFYYSRDTCGKLVNFTILFAVVRAISTVHSDSCNTLSIVILV